MELHDQYVWHLLLYDHHAIKTYDKQGKDLRSQHQFLLDSLFHHHK